MHIDALFAVNAQSISGTRYLKESKNIQNADINEGEMKELPRRNPVWRFRWQEKKRLQRLEEKNDFILHDQPHDEKSISSG